MTQLSYRMRKADKVPVNALLVQVKSNAKVAGYLSGFATTRPLTV